MLARTYRLTQGRVPLIGIGGIDSGSAAITKIEAGATLLQFYTGLVFEGPGLIGRIKRALIDYAERQKLARIGDATGIGAEAWANQPLQA
jgi:dihydroorotate dehydrogenase